MADSVVIKISGDIKDFSSKLDAIQKETKDLSATLTKTGIASSVAFAAVTAGAVKAVTAYKDSIKPAAELNNILKNQGIFSAKLVTEYGNIAKELKKVTGVDDEVITSGQAVIQRFIGQTKVTKELTQAILDFAAGTGVDTVTAFNLVGKSLGTTTNALGKYGIEIEGTLTAQEKMSVFIAQTNSKFRDQAKVLNESLGPLGRIQNSFGNIVEKVGEKLAPTIDGIASALENIADAASENDATGTVVSTIAIAIGTLSGAGVILSGAAKGLVAVSEAAAVLKVSVTALTVSTGIIGGVVAGLLALGVYADKLNEQNKFKNVEEAQKRIIENEKKLLVLREQAKQGIANQPLINALEQRNAILKKEIASSIQLNKVKADQAALDMKEAENAKKINKAGEDREKAKAARLKDIEDQKKGIEDLKKSLIDAGKSEFQALEDLRQRRLEQVGNDAQARLLIEQDHQDKLSKLTQERAEETTRKLQEEYDKREAAQKKAFDESVSNPFKALGEYGTQEEKDKAGMGAGVGVLNAVAGGREGARGLVIEGAAMGIDSFAPGVGQALKPLLGALTQGPEAVREMVREFAKGIPEFIGAIGESLPVLIEELAVQMPIVTQALIDQIPNIIGAFVRGAPKIIQAQIQQIPKMTAAIISSIPELIGSFIDGLTNGAGDFVQALIDAINPFSSDGPVGKVGGFIGDAISGVGDFLGFAEGGSASVKRVPSGFTGDRFPAFLSSDELVVKPDVARNLESFLNTQGNGSQEIALLNKILEVLQQPMTVQSDINIGAKKFAEIFLDMSRRNERLF